MFMESWTKIEYRSDLELVGGTNRSDYRGLHGACIFKLVSCSIKRCQQYCCGELFSFLVYFHIEVFFLFLSINIPLFRCGPHFSLKSLLMSCKISEKIYFFSFGVSSHNSLEFTLVLLEVRLRLYRSKSMQKLCALRSLVIFTASVFHLWSSFKFPEIIVIQETEILE